MCGTWQPSAKLNFRRKRIWTISHLKGAYAHQISWKYLDRGQRYGLQNEIRNGPSGGGILLPVAIMISGAVLCIIVHNFKTRSTAVADMPVERLCTSCSQYSICIPLAAIYSPDFPTRSHSSQGSYWQHTGRMFQLAYIPLSQLTPSMRGIHRAIGFIFGTGKLEWLELDYNLAKVAFSRLGTIHQRGRHTHTHSHVATAIAALTHCVRAAKVAQCAAELLPFNFFSTYF